MQSSSNARLPLILLLVVAIASCSTSGKSSSTRTPLQNENSPGTVVRVVDWGSELVGDPTETLTASQGCGESNAIWKYPYAYRCVTDQSLIVDPCFVSGGRLLCPEGPFERTYREVIISGLKPDKTEVDSSLEPWGVELTDGNQCWFADGHTWPRDDMRLHFKCQRGFLWGETDRSGNYWTMQFSEELASPMNTVEIAVAVY